MDYKIIEKVAVYKHIDDKHYTEQEIMKLDDTSSEFIEDKRINGLWKCVGIIDDKDDFDLSKIDKNGVISRLSFFPDGNANVTFNNDVSRSISYTKGFVKDFCIKGTMCAYEIKSINDKDYLIIEWKSGDYVFGGFISCYYVFEKVDM